MWLAICTCDITIIPAEHQANGRWECKGRSHSWDAHVHSVPCHPPPPPRPLVPHKPLSLPRPQLPWQKGSYHSASQLGRKRENSLPGGRGMAEVTSRRLFWKEMPRTSPTGFPGKGARQLLWGNQDGPCRLVCPTLPVPNLSPTLVYCCFSPPPFLRNLADVPEAQTVELSARDPEAQRRSLQELYPPPSSNH